MYKVTVTQKSKYTDTITGSFATLEDAQAFAKMVIENFKNVTVSIGFSQVFESDSEEEEE